MRKNLNEILDEMEVFCTLNRSKDNFDMGKFLEFARKFVNDYKRELVMIGCKNWKPKKCVRCGASLGLSDCFDPFEGTLEELVSYYKKIREKIQDFGTKYMEGNCIRKMECERVSKICHLDCAEYHKFDLREFIDYIGGKKL